MGIKIPYGNKYIVEVSGSIKKEILCSFCGKKFILNITRSEKGEGDSLLWLDNKGAQERAKYNAISELEGKLHNEVYIKPCPYCGKYQEDMVEELKKRESYKAQNESVIYLAIGLVTQLIIIFLNFPNQNSILSWPLFIRILTLGISVYLIIKRINKARAFNPNNEK